MRWKEAMMSKIEVLRERKNRLLVAFERKGLTKEQKHLDWGVERDYWHYGYAMALDDVLRNFEVVRERPPVSER